MTDINIIYVFYKIYDILLTIYIILINKLNYLYSSIDKKLYKSKNFVYIFNDNKFISKENYDSFIKIYDLKKIMNEENNKYFFIHEINYLEINFLSNNRFLNNDSLIKTNFTFILVEIINSKNTIDITNFLNNTINCYYLQDNILFDKNFIIWLQYNEFNIEKDYKINIIDNNINTIELDKNKYIKLSNNSYDIIEMF
jgi:hypothetical protein